MQTKADLSRVGILYKLELMNVAIAPSILVGTCRRFRAVSKYFASASQMRSDVTEFSISEFTVASIQCT